MSSTLKIRPKGYKCESCRYFAATKHSRYDGVCLQEIRAANNGEKGLAGNYREHFKNDWCMLYEAKKQSEKRRQQVEMGLLDGAIAVVPDKTGGDR